MSISRHQQNSFPYLYEAGTRNIIFGEMSHLDYVNKSDICLFTRESVHLLLIKQRSFHPMFR